MSDWRVEIRNRLASAKLEPTRETEIVEEIVQHLEDRYTDLLARGADPNVTDREGWTIFQYASWRAAEPISNDDLPELSADAGRPTGLGPGHAEVIALLRQAGVKR